MVAHGMKILLMCIWLSSAAFSSTEFSASTTISQAKIFQNQTTTLILTIKGADKDLYKDITLPAVEDSFNIISSSKSSSFSYINGDVSRQREYQYVLLPTKPGISIIDPFKIKYNNKVYTTKPIRVVVKEVKNSANSNVPTRQSIIQKKINQARLASQTSKSVFLETQVSTTNILIGEVIDYSIKLYRRVSLWSSISIDQDDIENAWQEILPTEKERIITKDNQRYYELELVRKKIRPLSAGVLDIPPLMARFSVDPFSGEYKLLSEQVTINVMEFPSPIPQTFNGAIGEYEIETIIPEDNQLSNNTFPIQIQITGTGNMESIQPPIIQDTKSYRIVSAPNSRDSVLENSVVFDYIIIPKVAGEIIIPPIEFTYFSKINNDYITIIGASATYNATMNYNNAVSASLNVKEDIRFLVTHSFGDDIQSMAMHPNLIHALILINGIFIILILANSIPIKKLKNKKRSAHIQRKQLLRQIQNLSEQNNIQQMEAILLETLTVYLGANITAVNPKEIHQSMTHKKVSDAVANSVMQWVKNAQGAKYSKNKANDNHSISDSLRRILLSLIKERNNR